MTFASPATSSHRLSQDRIRIWLSSSPAASGESQAIETASTASQSLGLKMHVTHKMTVHRRQFVAAMLVLGLSYLTNCQAVAIDLSDYPVLKYGTAWKNEKTGACNRIRVSCFLRLKIREVESKRSVRTACQLRRTSWAESSLQSRFAFPVAFCPVRKSDVP